MTSSITDRLAGAIFGQSVHAPVLVASTGAITLSGEQTIDGVSVTEGDRVLVKSQSTAANNGIYLAATSAWERSKDADGNRDLTDGHMVYVRQGSVSGGKLFILSSTSNPIIPGTDSQSWAVSTVLTVPTNVTVSTAGSSFLSATSTSAQAKAIGLGSTNRPNFGDELTLTSTDPSGNFGPSLVLFRNSTSPEDDDRIGNIRFDGKSDTGSTIIYSRIYVTAVDSSSTSLDAQISFQSMLESTLTTLFLFGPGGMTAAGRTDKGVGTVNVDSVYVSDNLLNQTFLASYETTSGAAGQSVANSSWNQMNINTVGGATDGWALSGNLLTPPVGVWDIDAAVVVPSSASRHSAARLYDHTAGSLISRGVTVNGSTDFLATVHGRYSANGTNQIRIDAYSTTTSTAVQTALNTGANETYLSLKAVRVQ